MSDDSSLGADSGNQNAQAEIEYVRTIELIDEAEPVEAKSHYERKWVRVAQIGTPIARVRVEPHDDARLRAMLGDNVMLADDGHTVLAAAHGTVRQTPERVWLERTLQLRGSVDFSTGNIDFPGDVIVGDNVVDLFRVKSGGSIEVHGAIEAADVEAAGNIITRGGVSGRGKAHCRAHASFIAHYITHATIEAHDDVIVGREIAASRVISGGMVRVERGPIAGGHVTALAGVECATLGRAASLGTLVEIAIDEQLRRACAEQLPTLQRQLVNIEKTRSTVQPLLARGRQLTPAQREQATELLFRADELETQTRQTLSELEAGVARMTEHLDAAITVTNQLCAGVVIRIGDVEAVVTQNAPGPLRIVRKQRGHERVIGIDRNGRFVPLRCRPYHDPATAALATVLPKKVAA